jgi:carboxyl-terminal processing protease
MNNLLKISTLILAVFLLTASQDEKLFKISKAFDIYGAAFKEVNEFYVEELDPDELLSNSLKGMLKELDPYTDFYQEKEKDQLNVITTGNYVGFGITIRQKDNQTLVSGFANDFMAYDSGLRIGDILYKIDGDKVLGLDSKELKNYTQGKPGSIAKVELFRKNDTINLELQRHKVRVENVLFYGRTERGMGYIKLERFSKGTSNEIKDAVYDLKRRNISGLILDLRDNPGGLLDEAIKVSELFLPKESLIVSTKSKNANKNREYFSRSKPIELNLPIAVLINENSASASEIVAGALQDHDRGVIIGRSSFGKGLVQTVKSLPYKTSLKLTTARYYTPSGRSIQKKDYYDKVKSDTSIFFTDAGRPLRERKGISPDSIMLKKKFSSFVTKIYNDNMIFDFANEFAYKIEKDDKGIDYNFQVSDYLIDDFASFLKKQSYIYKNKSIKKIEDLYIDAIELDVEAESLLDDLEEKFKLDLTEYIEKNQEDIRELIHYEIMKRFYNSRDLTRIFAPKDTVIKTAENILKSEYYSVILQPYTFDEKQ